MYRKKIMTGLATLGLFSAAVAKNSTEEQFNATEVATGRQFSTKTVVIQTGDTNSTFVAGYAPPENFEIRKEKNGEYRADGYTIPPPAEQEEGLARIFTAVIKQDPYLDIEVLNQNPKRPLTVMIIPKKTFDSRENFYRIEAKKSSSYKIDYPYYSEKNNCIYFCESFFKDLGVLQTADEKVLEAIRMHALREALQHACWWGALRFDPTTNEDFINALRQDKLPEKLAEVEELFAKVRRAKSKVEDADKKSDPQVFLEAAEKAGLSKKQIQRAERFYYAAQEFSPELKITFTDSATPVVDSYAGFPTQNKIPYVPKTVAVFEHPEVGGTAFLSYPDQEKQSAVFYDAREQKVINKDSSLVPMRKQALFWTLLPEKLREALDLTESNKVVSHLFTEKKREIKETRAKEAKEAQEAVEAFYYEPQNFRQA